MEIEIRNLCQSKMFRQKFLLLLFFFTEVRGYKAGYTSDARVYGRKYLFMSSSILILTAFRYLTKTTGIRIPYSIFTICVGIFWGIGTLNYPWMAEISDVAIQTLNKLPFIYMPIVIYSTAFLLDVHIFFKSLPQILIISIPVLFLSCAGTGFTMKLLLDDVNFTSVEAILFGSISGAVYPVDALRWLKGTSIYTKHATILLEGETVISASFALTLMFLVRSYIAGWTIWWYQFLARVAWIFFLGKILIHDRKSNKFNEISVSHSLYAPSLLFTGVPLSYLYGLLGTALMRIAYNDSVGLMLITVTMCYTGYFFMLYVAKAGILGTMVIGVVMGLERAALTKKMEKTVIHLWKLISAIVNGILFINIGVITPSILQSEVNFSDYVLVFVTYLVTNITRFMSFFLFSPILTRIGYGMPFQNMIICVWSGLKNPFCLIIAHQIYDDMVSVDPKKSRLFFLHTVAVYMLLLLINGSCVPNLMKALGLSNISMSKQINMNNCMRFIYEARARTIAILKMDRLLSDANWPLVMTSTALKHPYKSNLRFTEDEDEEEDEYFLGYKYTFCPDCEKNIQSEPTDKEMKEMTKEAKLRILKLKKTAYSRQYENGMMSKEGNRIMQQVVEIAVNSEDLMIEMDGLFKLFDQEGMFCKFFLNQWEYFLNMTDDFKPPRQAWRLYCYLIVKHRAFNLFFHAVVLINISFVIYHTTYVHHERALDVTDKIVYSYWVFLLIYLIEFCLKIFALSWVHICRHGFKIYFRSYWNILDFSIMVTIFVAVILHQIDFSLSLLLLSYIDIALLTLLSIRFLRFFSLLKMCPSLRNFIAVSVINYLDVKVNRYKTLAYELGKNYVAGDEEILENLQQIVDNDKIREQIKEKLTDDRAAVTKRMGLAQKRSPVVAATVKTILAINMVLEGMKENLKELKVSGWVDDVEYSKLLESLGERYKFILNMKTIEPPSPKLILREILYMGEADELIEFLYTNVSTKKFDPGDVVVNEGESLEGVYILITGMFFMAFQPHVTVIEKFKVVGTLPIIDYISSLTYEEPVTDYIVSGNTIGELSLLANRPYSGTIIAETHSQVFVLNRNILRQAFERDNDPVKGLKCRMWKYVSFKRAVTVLLNVPSYRSYTLEKIKSVVERSFAPDLSNFKVFVVNEMIEDIILIEGVVVDFNSKDIYTGLCHIPRSVQSLVFPKGSSVNIETVAETKLLIIPAKDCSEYEIMITVEETSELVDDEKSRYLHQIIEKNAYMSKASSRMKSVLIGRKKRAIGTDSAKNKLTFVNSKSENISKVSVPPLQ